MLSILVVRLVISLYYRGSFYDPTLNVLKCENANSCIHEAAHKYDHLHGDISNTVEWKNAVDEYQETALLGYTSSDQMSTEIIYLAVFPGVNSSREKIKNDSIFMSSFWNGGWGGYTELYASIVEDAAGDINKIPVSLQKFYNMDEINSIMKGLGY